MSKDLIYRKIIYLAMRLYIIGNLHDYVCFIFIREGSCGRDRMVVGVTTIFAYMKSVPIPTEYRPGRNIQHHVIKFVRNLRQVGGFLRIFRFPPPIKLIATI